MPEPRRLVEPELELLEDLRVNINRSPCGALSFSLKCSGRGPNRFFEAKELPLRVSLDDSWASNLSSTVSRRATRLATKAAVRNCEALREVRAARLIISNKRLNAGESGLPGEAENSSFANLCMSTMNVNSLSIIIKSYIILLNNVSILDKGEDLIPMGLESEKARESKMALSNCLASNKSLSFWSLNEKQGGLCVATLALKSGGKILDFLGGNTLLEKCPSCGKNQEGSSLLSKISKGKLFPDSVQ